MNLSSSVSAMAVGCALVAIPALAGSGQSGADFLTYGQGARAVGMGESQTAAADDAYAAYWNPAGLAVMTHPEAAFSYHKGLEGLDAQHASAAYPLKPGRTFGLNMTRASVASFQGYDAQGAKQGQVDAGDLALGAAYGESLLRDVGGRAVLSAGANAKWIEQRLHTARARTWALDLGLLYTPRERGDDSGFRVGAAVQNLGPAIRFDRLDSPLPRAYRGGVAYRAYPKGDSLTLSADGVFSAEQGDHGAFGAEYVVYRVLALRLGYRTGQDVGLGFRAGVGFLLKVLEIDYALAGYGELGIMHRVGLTVRLGGPVEKTSPDETAIQALLQRGHRMTKEGRVYEAILEYDKVLEIDPGNKEALIWMERANEKLRK